MNKPKRDWRLILKTNNYNSIFIKSTVDENCLSILYKNINEISNVNEFLLMLPSIQEIDSKDNSNYLHNFAPLLKSFVEDVSKKTLITEESVLNTLLKKEKRSSFFKFLLKQKKNIVVFCSSDYEEYISDITSQYNHLIMNPSEWKNNTELFERFDDIKFAISQTYNPFKNPVNAFKKYSQEEK